MALLQANHTQPGSRQHKKHEGVARTEKSPNSVRLTLKLTDCTKSEIFHKVNAATVPSAHVWGLTLAFYLIFAEWRQNYGNRLLS